jgi:ABC-type multidrug transport system fused ATPase/permease subunit
MNLRKVFGLYFHYIRQQKKLYTLFILSMFVSTGLEMFVPYITGLFIQAAKDGNVERMVSNLVFMGVIMLVQILFIEGVCFRIAITIAVRFTIAARKDLFTNIQQWDYEYHSNKSTGKTVSYIGKLDTAIFGYLYQFNFFMFGNLLALIMLLTVIATFAPLITLVSCGIILLYLPFFFKLLKFNFEQRGRVNEADSEVTDVLVDNMAGFETVKAFVQEQVEIARFNAKNIFANKVAWEADYSYRYLFGSAQIVGVIVLVTGIAIMVSQFAAGSISLVTTVIIISYLLIVPQRLLNSVFSLRELVKSYADMRNYEKLMNIKPTVVSKPGAKLLTAAKGEISLKDITFHYGKNKALQNISLTIHPEEQIAFVGPSGAGKTTITKLIMRYYDPQEGAVLLDGNDIRDFTLESVRSHIGIVPQDPVMFNNTILYNVGYGLKDATREKIEEACKLAQIHDFILTLPLGYETVVGERGIKLSGGQRQRLAIARMILKNPRILIFDEATSQLDSESEYLIKEALKNLSKDKTTIIIAHRLSTIINCDRIFVLDRGKVVQTGTHKELVAEPGIYQKLWNIQSGGFIFEE